MRFIPTAIKSAYIIELEPIEDDRGFFARSFARDELERLGVNNHIAQANVSFNHKQGTLRGMHYQVEPAPEWKLIRCTKGSIFDAIIDLRRGSSTYGNHAEVELTSDNRLAFYIPELCAHGFQTLMDDTEVHYQVGAFYTPEAERGLRYDDPAFDIPWPLPVTSISPKDASWPDFGGEA